ncbi:hypothetical protein ACSVDM_15130 [Nocardia sp. JW2]|uniref:hypothetical protein n=1 Tax=Nocardia sp. JW2 TaxID=3450738 RepID=UPI003F421FCE
MKRKWVFSLACTVGLVALCAVIALGMWRSGDSVARAVSKYVGCFGISILFVVVLAVRGRIPGRAAVRVRSIEGSSITVVPGSGSYFWLFQGFWGCLAILGIGAAVEIGVGSWRTHYPLALILGGMGVAAASVPALALAGRLRPGSLRLGPDEIVHRGFSSRTRLAWADVVRVSTSYDQVPVIEIAGPHAASWTFDFTIPKIGIGGKSVRIWSLDRDPYPGRMRLECPRFDTDPITLYRYLAYYTANPSARRELGSNASIERWHAVCSEVGYSVEDRVFAPIESD